MTSIEKFEALLNSDKNLASEYKELTEGKDAEKLFTFMKEHGLSDEDIETLKSVAIAISNAPTMAEFNRKMESDEDLAAKYKEVVASNDEQAIVDFLKAHGVSEADIKSLSNRELSDTELDGVNGGIGIFGFAAAFVVCATVVAIIGMTTYILAKDK